MQTVDPISEDWMPMAMFPPQPCETFEIRLPDGSAHRAFWTGKFWLLRGQPVVPQRWREAA